MGRHFQQFHLSVTQNNIMYYTPSVYSNAVHTIHNNLPSESKLYKQKCMSPHSQTKDTQ